MKVAVAHRATVTTVVEIDDKFAEALPAWENGDDETYTNLIDELHEILCRKVTGEICQVFTEDDEVLYEL